MVGSGGSPPRRRRLEWGRLALVAGGIVVGLTLAEAALRVSGRVRQMRRDARPVPYYTWSTYATDGRAVSPLTGPLKLVLDPVLLYRNQPDQAAPWFTINSRGYRGPELRAAEAGVPRVVLVGSSAAFGTGLPSDGDSLAGVLEAVLGRTEVVNAAVIGYVSGQERVLLETELLDLAPQTVLAFDGWNDLRSGRIVRDGVIAPDPFLGIQNKCWTANQVQTSVLFAARMVLARLFPELHKRVRRTLVMHAHAGPRRSRGERITARATAYARNVLAMSAACRARGVRFVAVLQPDRDQAPDYRRFRELALEALRGGGLNPIESSAIAGLQRTHFLDEMHLTAEGTRLIAGAIASRLATS
jgi:hypothetical protein